MKKVSIVMPVYNGKEYIRESIESIINQSYKEWEFIIVNEFGSDDGSKEIIEEYAAKDKRIKLIQNTKREGISASLNIGLKAATGEYIARMDSDDISGPKRIERQVEFLDQNPSIILCGLQPEFIGDKEVVWDLERNPEQIRHNIFFYTPCVHPTIMFRREIIDKYKLFYNEEYKATEDYEYFSRIVGVADIANIGDKSLFKYRMYENNATNRNNYFGIGLYGKVMQNCFKNYLDLEFTDEEINLLNNHISVKELKGEELYEAVVKLDLLLKKILLATKKHPKFNIDYMFNTLKSRWNELRWTIPEKEKTVAIEFLIEKGIYNREKFLKDAPSNVKPDITVLLPVYNSEKYILDSVLSMVDQTYPNFELLIMVENDNKDDTEEYLSLIKDKRIKIIKNKTKLGLAKTLNEGIRNAKTKYIARMDSDDLSMPDRFEKERKFLEENEDIILVSSWQRHFGSFGTYIHNSEGDEEDLKAAMLFKCDVCHSTVMFRTDVVKENNFYYNEEMAMEDFDLWNRMLENYRICCIPKVLGEYRIHGENITQAKHQKVIESEIKIISRSLERLGIKPSQYDKRLLIGWDNIYNDEPEMKVKAKKLFELIIKQNSKYNIYSEKSLMKALSKRMAWIEGKEEYVLEKPKNRTIKSRIKSGIKRIAKPIVWPVYSRIMNRVDNKIEENNRLTEELVKRKIEENENIKGHQLTPEMIELIKGQKKLEDLVEENRLFKEQISRYINSEATSDYIPYKSGRIRIGIVFQVPSFWPSIESVYEELVKDGRFDLKFYLLDLSFKEPTQMEGAKQFLIDNKINYELLSIPKLDSFKPHVLIIQTPYDEWHRTEEYYSTALKKKGIRLIYIPYGTEFSGTEESLRLQFNTDFINNMWRIYTLSEVTQKYYCIYSRHLISEIKALGHPKYDGLYNNKYTTNYDFRKRANGKKIVLVKIHFPKVFNGKLITPPMEVYENLVDTIDKNINGKFKNLYFIFMLHPLLYDEKKTKGSTNLINKLNAAENIMVFKEEDYREPLCSADAFICDRSSIAVEMAIFNKPILYLQNANNHERNIVEFDRLLNTYEQGSDLDDIIEFLDNVKRGIDNNQEKRNRVFGKIVNEIDGNAGKRIVENIYRDITEGK